MGIVGLIGIRGRGFMPSDQGLRAGRVSKACAVESITPLRALTQTLYGA